MMKSVLQRPSSVVPPSGQARVFLVDDRDAAALHLALEAAGDYQVVRIDSTAGVESHVDDGVVPDVMLIRDVFKDGTSGINLCRKLRGTMELATTPIVLISDGGVDERTVLAGLTCGADDYITHEASPRELVARLEIHLRVRQEREMLRHALDQRKRYRDEAHRDALTGIANRRACDSEITAALMTDEPVSLFLIDVDHFKYINDNYGHPVGDEVLQRVAKALEGAARREDLVARFGGEEFAIVARGASYETAEQIGERLRLAIQQMDEPPDVTASVGVATWHPEPQREAARLVEMADQALYEAKNQGRNQVRGRSFRPPAA